MLCCDVCERWFHPECVGVTMDEYDAHAADRNFRWECKRCRARASEIVMDSTCSEVAAMPEDGAVHPGSVGQPTSATVGAAGGGEALFCVCQQPWRGEEMLTCDSCDGWFHPLCQDMSDAEYLRLFAPESLGLPPAESPPKWTCCTCRLQSSTATTALQSAESTTKRPAVGTNNATSAAATPAPPDDRILSHISAFATGQASPAPAATAKATAGEQAQPKHANGRAGCFAASAGAQGETLIASGREAEPRATRWPVGRRRSSKHCVQQLPIASLESSSVRADAPRGVTTGKMTASSSSCKSALTTGASTGGRAVSSSDSRTTNCVRITSSWAGTRRRGTLPGAREEGSGGALCFGRGGNCIPEWWEEDLRRLAQEERQRQQLQQQQRVPKRKRHKGSGRAAVGANDGNKKNACSKGEMGLTAETDVSQCPICLGTLSPDNAGGDGCGTSNFNSTRTPCSHVFCRSCLFAALTRCSGPPRCPLCRRNLSGFLQQLQRSAVVKVDLF